MNYNLLAFHRRCHRLMNSKITTVDSSKEGAFFNPHKPSPITYAAGMPIVIDVSVASSVIGLLKRSSPVTIFRAIVSVIVNAVKRVIVRRSSPHIGVEVFKRVEPSITNSNTSSPISSIIFTRRKVTSYLHAVPSVEFYGVSLSMGCDSSNFIAAARFSVTRPKAATCNHTFGSARTNTGPSCIPAARIFSSRNYSKSIKGLTSKVFEIVCSHNILSDIAQKRSSWQSALSAVIRVAYPSHSAIIA